MDWFYAESGRQVGPISQARLEELVRHGRISPDTPVWREGMAQWQPFQLLLRGFQVPTVGEAFHGVSRCTECQREYSQSEMIQFERAWICGGCKPIYLQRIKEGAAPTGGMLWRHKKQLVMRHGTPMPDRCVKCNSPAHGSRLKRQLYWHPAGYYLIFLLNVLVYLIVSLLVRKQSVILIGLCDAHRKRRVVVITISWVVGLIGALLIVGGITGNDGWSAGLGVALALGSAITGAILAPLVTAAKIDKEFVWIRGACYDFLESLPEWNGPG